MRPRSKISHQFNNNNYYIDDMKNMTMEISKEWVIDQNRVIGQPILFFFG